MPHASRDAIIAYVMKHQIELIVVSTHERSGAARRLIGSVAEQVVHKAPVPVFIVGTRGGNANLF